jgi:hypothetical protein
MTGPGYSVLAMRHVITLELDLSTLRRAIGGGSYVRGAEYARQQAVLHVTWDPQDTALRGMVRGRDGNVYQTAASFSLADGRPAEVEMGGQTRKDDGNAFGTTVDADDIRALLS